LKSRRVEESAVLSVRRDSVCHRLTVLLQALAPRFSTVPSPQAIVVLTKSTNRLSTQIGLLPSTPSLSGCRTPPDAFSVHRRDKTTTDTAHSHEEDIKIARGPANCVQANRCRPRQGAGGRLCRATSTSQDLFFSPRSLRSSRETRVREPRGSRESSALL